MSIDNPRCGVLQLNMNPETVKRGDSINMDIPKGQGREDLIYKTASGKDLMLTFLPPIEKKYEYAPIYFIIPGGGWHNETRESMLEFSKASVENLRKDGFAVVSADYRVCGDGAVMQDIITDCFDALRYVANYAEILKIDKNKIVTSGHSAGGHLALMLAYAPKNKFYAGYEFGTEFTVVATAPMSPATDLADTALHNLRDLNDVFGGKYDKEEMDKMSPITYVSKTVPPTILFAGTCDYLIFSTSSQLLYKNLKENGVETEIVYSHGGGHSFEKVIDNIEPSVSMEQIQEKITDFVIKHIQKGQ